MGRPPKNLAGDVEARILDAAQRVFLEKGYNGTTIDEIAKLAPASKPTIYSHFRDGKEELFAAAVVARVFAGLRAFEGHTSSGRTVQERLTDLGTELVGHFMIDMLEATRVTIAEADRFPELSRHVHEAGRDWAANAVSQVLNSAAHALSSRGPLNNERRQVTSQIFMDLVLLPMLMRALMRDDAEVPRKDLTSFIRERVNFFWAACKTGWAQ